MYYDRLVNKRERELIDLRDRYLARIYNGLKRKQSYEDIVRALKRETKHNLNSSLAICVPLYRECKKLVKKIQLHTRDINPLQVPFTYLLSSNNTTIRKITSSTIGKDLRKYEAQVKKLYFRNLFASNRKKNKDLGFKDYQKIIFYLCSAHNDCAKDHQEYQGRLYVDRNWKYQIRDVDIRTLIEKFIAKKHILTLQEVVSGKPYLITRPHCRHFIRGITLENVLNKSERKLIEENKMYIYIHK